MNDALVQVVLLNEIYAVGMLLELLLDVGDTLITSVLPPAVYPPAVARSVVPGVKVVSATFTAEASATFQASVPAFMPSSNGSMAAVYLTYDAVGIKTLR